jgi:hypothetical protein
MWLGRTVRVERRSIEPPYTSLQACVYRRGGLLLRRKGSVRVSRGGELRAVDNAVHREPAIRRQRQQLSSGGGGGGGGELGRSGPEVGLNAGYPAATGRLPLHHSRRAEALGSASKRRRGWQCPWQWLACMARDGHDPTSTQV